MSNDLWRWADPDGQQRRVRLDELRAALAGGLIAPNTPVWHAGWDGWRPAQDVPELTSPALSAANGIVLNIPPPPLAMLAAQKDFEAKAGESFAPPPMTGEAGDAEPPPPPRYVPLPVKVPSSPSLSPQPVVTPRMPFAPTPSAAPPAPLAPPAVAKSEGVAAPRRVGVATTIGLPPPPEVAAMAAARKASTDPMIEELSGSILLDDSGQSLGALAPPTDPIVRTDSRPSYGDALGYAPIRRPGVSLILDDLKEMKAGRPPKNKLLVGVVAVVALSVVISLLGLVVSLVRSKPSELSTSGAAASGAAASASAPTPGSASAAAAETAPPSQAAAAGVEPKAAPAEAALGDCALAGEAHVVSPHAYVQAGVEAALVPGAIALGFATDPRSGVAVTVDPASIGITSTLRARALGGDARRMSPVLDKGKLTLVAAVDRKNDKLQGRRVVATSPPIDVGVAEGALVWAPHDQNSYAKLFALDGDGAADALRAIALPSKGIAIALRRGNAVYVGAATGDAVLTAAGPLSRIEGLGQVGSPALAVSGETVMVAWADRAAAQDPWQVRWTTLGASGAPAAPAVLALPEGGLGMQAMSPSLAGLGAGRFVMTWSEGTTTHQVRAITLNADGSRSGAPIALSPAGVNAGQPQVAVGSDGRGVVAYLASKGRGYELQATPIACSAK